MTPDPDDELDGCDVAFDDALNDTDADLYVLFAGADTPAKRKKAEAKWKALFDGA